MRISVSQLNNIRSFQPAKDTGSVRRRSQQTQSGQASSQPVRVSLSAPVERVLKRAVELYTSDANVREDEVARGKLIVENWSGISDEQIDTLLDSLRTDLA